MSHEVTQRPYTPNTKHIQTESRDKSEKHKQKRFLSAKLGICVNLTLSSVVGQFSERIKIQHQTLLDRNKGERLTQSHQIR